MAETGVILATSDGAKTLQRLLAQTPEVAGSGQPQIPPDLLIDPMLIDLSQLPEEGDDYTSVVARQMRRVNDVIEYLQTQNVRLLGGRALAVQTGTQLTLVSTHLHLDVQLTEDLDAATDFATSPATATANVLKRNSSGNLEKLQYNGSDVQITITNRNEAWDTVPAETFGGAVLKNDEWRPDDFDCDAAAGGLI